MKYRLLKLFLFVAPLVCGAEVASAQRVVKVAAAANLRYVLSEIEVAYERANPEVDLQVNYGASGAFYQQITNGAPYDLFLSADDILPVKIAEAGLAADGDKPYACGKLAIYGLREDLVELGMEVLKSVTVARIAVANPRTAPYGTRSVEILKSLGLWDALERRIVYGDSIAQAAQFAMTGNCDLGFVSLSLLLNPEAQIKGSYHVIDEALYAPIVQSGVVLKGGANLDDAAIFFDYLLGDQALPIWERYGYSTPK